MFDPTVARARPLVVLGIDPGVSCCGYGAVRRDGANVEALAYGVLRTAASAPLPERLAALGADLEGLVADLEPAALAVERVLFQVNARTAMSVGQASGLALVAAARAGVAVFQYSPNEVKLAIAGDGGAAKPEVQAMVARLLQLDATPRPADAADALALALCHLWRAPLRAATGGDAPAVAPRLRAAIERAVAGSGPRPKDAVR